MHAKVSDLGLLAATAKEARENLGVARIDVVADRGYFKLEDVEACEAAFVVAHISKPKRSTAAPSGHFTKDDFRYEADDDVYLCPGGHRLAPRYRNAGRGPVSIDYCNRAACRTCGIRSQCTKGAYRKIQRYENEAVLDRMAQRVAARPELADIRRTTVEHPFGSIKQWMGQGAFLMRRLENVQGEFSLTALAYNMRRALTLLGVPTLIAAVRP